jgi:hypothetical protein
LLGFVEFWEMETQSQEQQSSKLKVQTKKGHRGWSEEQESEKAQRSKLKAQSEEHRDEKVKGERPGIG